MQDNLTTKILSKIPSQQELEGIFIFVNDLTLRTNITIAFRYIYFQIALKEELKLRGPLNYSLNKGIILYSASITERFIKIKKTKKLKSIF